MSLFLLVWDLFFRVFKKCQNQQNILEKWLIDTIIDLKSSENRMNKIIELETSEEQTIKIKIIKIQETIRNGLDELKIMKISCKL